LKRFQKLLIIILLLIITSNIYSQNVVINEVMASNSFTLADEDGDYPDWIELYNSGSDTVNLLNWGISDSKKIPFKWVFPDVTLTAGQFLVVFASDKDRRDWIAYWDTIINWGDEWRYFPGTREPPSNWKNIGFDDTSWQTGNSGFGSGDDDDQTELSVGLMSVFIRKSFIIDNKQDIAGAILHIDYDDAFVAYLNGVEFARDNIGTPGVPPAYNQGADNWNHEAKIYQGGVPDAFMVSNWQELLVEGENVLAIQVHNIDSNSSDMTCIPFFSIGFKYVPDDPQENPAILNLNSPSLHTNFKVSAQGDTLFLIRPDSTLTDSVECGKILTDHSYGRQPDGTVNWFFFDQPSPGSSNSETAYSQFAEEPIFSHEGGFYNNPFELSIESPDSELTIYYTLDSSEPDSQSMIYSEPIPINSTTIVRALTSGVNILSSSITTKTYLLGYDSELPVICLTSDPYYLWDDDYGIYVLGTPGTYETGQPYYGANFWEDWERPVHIEFYENDGTLGFTMDGGIKIHGGWSRAHPQKSLAIFARGRYGFPEINYQLFKNRPFDKYQSFILRNSANDWGRTQFCDALIHTLIDPLDLENQAYRPCVVYINGEYFSFLNLREKINEDYLSMYYDVDPDSVDILEIDGVPVEGSSDQYDNLVNFIENNDLSIQSNYEYVETQMEIDNFINYYAFEIYIDNRDWPGNNIKFWRPRKESGRWRWIVYDTEWGFGLDAYNGGNAYQFNTLEFALEPNGPSWPNPPWSTLFLRKLLENETFKIKFINRFADQINTVFESNHVLQVIDSLEIAIKSEIPSFWEKWRQSYPDYSPERLWWGSPDDWYNYNNIMRSFAENRPAYMQQFIVERFNLPGTGNLTLNLAQNNTGWIQVSSIKPDSYPWTGTYFRGVPLEVKAISAPGYQFSGWSGSINSDAEVILIDMTSNVSITAHFEKNPLPSKLVINEINYNSANDFNTEDWVEIFYEGDENLDISEWLIKDERDTNIFEIPQNTILEPGNYLVFCRDTSLFKLFFPDVENFIGNLDFGFDGNSDMIRIFDTESNLIDSVNYRDSAPWPSGADGLGATLELLNPYRDNSIAENWGASEGHGTPGAVNSVYTSTEIDELITIPNKFTLSQNYPNPFNPITIIRYSLAGTCHLDLSIYNILGQKIVTLVSKKQEAGHYKMEWDAHGFSSGIYFYKLVINSDKERIIKTKKMILLQ
jgi:hypothetical protein